MGLESIRAELRRAEHPCADGGERRGRGREEETVAGGEEQRGRRRAQREGAAGEGGGSGQSRDSGTRDAACGETGSREG